MFGFDSGWFCQKLAVWLGLGSRLKYLVEFDSEIQN